MEELFVEPEFMVVHIFLAGAEIATFGDLFHEFEADDLVLLLGGVGLLLLLKDELLSLSLPIGRELLVVELVKGGAIPLLAHLLVKEAAKIPLACSVLLLAFIFSEEFLFLAEKEVLEESLFFGLALVHVLLDDGVSSELHEGLHACLLGLQLVHPFLLLQLEDLGVALNVLLLFLVLLLPLVVLNSLVLLVLFDYLLRLLQLRFPLLLESSRLLLDLQLQCLQMDLLGLQYVVAFFALPLPLP